MSNRDHTEKIGTISGLGEIETHHHIAAYQSSLTWGKGASRCRSPTCQDSWWLTLKMLSREKKAAHEIHVNLLWWSTWPCDRGWRRWRSRTREARVQPWRNVKCAPASLSVFVCFSCVCYKWGCLGQRHLWNRHCLKIPSMREKSPDWRNMMVKIIANTIYFSQYHQPSQHLYCQQIFHTLSWGGAWQMSNATSCLFCCRWKMVKNQMYFFFSPKVFLIICIQIP